MQRAYGASSVKNKNAKVFASFDANMFYLVYTSNFIYDTKLPYHYSLQNTA